MELDDIVNEIIHVQDNGLKMNSLKERFPDIDLRTAYQIQSRIHDRRLEEGWAPVGRKLGFTNENIWGTYGVESPIWAHIYDHTVSFTEGRVSVFDLSKTLEPRIEPEIVIALKSPLEHEDSSDAIVNKVEWWALGFEIVHSRLANWKFTAEDVVADMGLHTALIIGEKLPIPAIRDHLRTSFEEIEIELLRGSQVKARGVGANALGGAHRATRFLLENLGSDSRGLFPTEDEIICTGTVTDAFRVQTGETWSVRLCGENVANLELRFE